MDERHSDDIDDTPSHDTIDDTPSHDTTLGSSPSDFRQVRFGDIPTHPSFQFLVITKKTAKKYRRLFDGFQRAKIVSYVASPQNILELFDKGYQYVEIIVGKEFSGDFDRLSEKEPEIIYRLIELKESGQIKIYLSKVTDHSKSYALYSETHWRYITGSANFTATATDAKKQINEIAYCDDIPQCRMEELWQEHLAYASPFMDDLMDLFKQHSDIPRETIIKMWLDKESRMKVDLRISESNNTLGELVEKSTASIVAGEPYYNIKVDKIHHINGKQLARLKDTGTIIIKGEEGIVKGAEFMRYIETTINLPYMVVNFDIGEVGVIVGGEYHKRTKSLDSPQLVDKALACIEDYINTVDFGESLDLLSVKRCMYEATLYVLFSPFANEYARRRRELTKGAEVRGPKHLCIYGRTGNGKTTFMAYMAKLLTGCNIEIPKAEDHFNKTKVNAVLAQNTLFPLMYDNLELGGIGTVGRGSKAQTFVPLVKTWWEKNWELRKPLIIFSTNEKSSILPVADRIYSIEFDVLFPHNIENIAKLGDLMAEPCNIFLYFSYLYFEELKENPLTDYDEVTIARRVMGRLYKYAQRPLPQFFPDGLLAESINAGRKDWKELLELKKLMLCWKDNSITVDATPDMEVRDVEKCLGHLLQQQNIKAYTRGKTIIVQSPDTFLRWLNLTLPKPDPIIQKGSNPDPKGKPPLFPRFRQWLSRHG